MSGFPFIEVSGDYYDIGFQIGSRFKKQFKKEFNVLMPAKKFCTDNAVMTAITAYFHWKNGDKPEGKIEAKADLTL